MKMNGSRSGRIPMVHHINIEYNTHDFHGWKMTRNIER